MSKANTMGDDGSDTTPDLKLYSGLIVTATAWSLAQKQMCKSSGLEHRTQKNLCQKLGCYAIKMTHHLKIQNRSSLNNTGRRRHMQRMKLVIAVSSCSFKNQIKVHKGSYKACNAETSRVKYRDGRLRQQQPAAV